MTQRDATPEELELAERIANQAAPMTYSYYVALRNAALSAIQQTTELAAIMCDTGYSVEPGESCAVALRNNDHLKGQADG